MKEIKRFVYKLLRWFWELRQFQRFKKYKSFNKIVVVDIDNTLTINKLSDPVNHKDPIPRPGMINYIKEAIREGEHVIFLSARDFLIFEDTLKWLKKHQVYQDSNQALFMVRSSLAKIPLLEYLVEHNSKIVFIDDLSYNHENGEVKYYTEVKEKLETMPLQLLSIDFINAQN